MRGTPEERFWAKVDKAGACWLWTATKTQGYGMFKLEGKSRLAHRVSYEWAKGEIPEGLDIDHKCHTPSCVNPEHLRAVTTKQNMENYRGAYRTSKSGVRGVSWHKRMGKWKAAITHNRKCYHVGYFDDLAAAESALIEVRNEMFTHNDLDRRAV